MRNETRHLFSQLRDHIRAGEVEGALVVLQELYGAAEFAFESMPTGFLLVDRDGRIMQANLLAADVLLAVPPSPLTLIGQSLYSYIKVDDRDTLFLHLRAIFQKRRYHSCEVRLAEMEKSLRLDSVYERDPYGKGTAKTVITEAQGERFMLEILRQANEELEQRVQERTAALSRTLEEKDRIEAMLREHTAMLERANRELQDFAFIASHDLQEPLRKVRAFGDLLKTRFEQSLGEEGREYIVRMQNASARMQDLLRSLLAYSRVATKGEPFVKTNLRRAAENAVSNLEITIREKKARVRVGDLPTVEADGAQMTQLFQNLIANALKYGVNGKPPQVRISARSAKNARGLQVKTHKILVKDNGIGFDEKYLEKIFQPFQRLHGRDAYEGVGMGLAICKKIVDHHGGTITARSRPGKGATFIVTLPEEQEE